MATILGMDNVIDGNFIFPISQEHKDLHDDYIDIELQELADKLGLTVGEWSLGCGDIHMYDIDSYKYIADCDKNGKLSEPTVSYIIGFTEDALKNPKFVEALEQHELIINSVNLEDGSCWLNRMDMWEICSPSTEETLSQLNPPA